MTMISLAAAVLAVIISLITTVCYLVTKENSSVRLGFESTLIILLVIEIVLMAKIFAQGL